MPGGPSDGWARPVADSVPRAGTFGEGDPMQPIIGGSLSSRTRADEAPSMIGDEGAEPLQRLPLSAGNHRAMLDAPATSVTVVDCEVARQV